MTVKVMADSKGGSWFRGLHVCGSVWTCPVCSARISDFRRAELQKGIDNAVKYGRGVSMVTLTFSHQREQPLADVLGGFGRALRRLKSGRAFAALQDRFNIRGEIRALEVTHGRAGWHPHTHSLTFTQAPMDDYTMGRLHVALFMLWRRACAAEGLGIPTFANGVQIQGASAAADYVGKWGFATELAKSHLKRAKRGGRNPWQLLAAAHHGDKRAGWLFCEFADEFSGKRQLFWSRREVAADVAAQYGLDPDKAGRYWLPLRRELDAGEEMQDQEILDLEPPDERELVAIDLDTWAVVRRSKSQAKILELAAEGALVVKAFLNRLRCTVPLYNGRLLGPRDDWEL